MPTFEANFRLNIAGREHAVTSCSTAVWRAGILRTGKAPFETKFLRFPMGPVSADLAANYVHDGNPENVQDTVDCDKVIETLGGAMSPELVARSHSYPEYSADEHGTKITPRQVRRLAHSFVQQIRIPKDGKACRHSRHCGASSCLKQVVRYLEMLCSRDYELFCWASVADILKHAKRRDGGKPYERTEVHFCRKFVLETGMFVRDKKFRNGVLRDGWTMVPHGQLAAADASYCVWARPEVSTSVSTSEAASVNIGVNINSPSVNIGVNIEDEKCQHPVDVKEFDINTLQRAGHKTHNASQEESGFNQEESERDRGNKRAQTKTQLLSHSFSKSKTAGKEEQEGDKEMGLSDKLKRVVEKTGRLEVADQLAQEETQHVLVGGIIQDDEVKSLGMKLFKVSGVSLAGNNLRPAANLLKLYSEDEIMLCFSYWFNNLPDDFARKMALNSFFKDGGGEIIILSVREEMAKQKEMQRRIDAMPCKPLVEAPVEDEDEEWDGQPVDF
jgi:hypothetical protein